MDTTISTIVFDIGGGIPRDKRSKGYHIMAIARDEVVPDVLAAAGL